MNLFLRKGIFLLLLLNLSFSSNVSAQNLVPNSGFEAYSALPTSVGQWSRATSWSNVNGWVPVQWPYASPDYFHTSGSGMVQMPNTVFGVVSPYSGNAIMGMSAYYPGTLNFREYTAIQLSAPMVVGTTYTVSFYITSGVPGSSYNGLGIANYGVCLSAGALTQLTHEPINATPQYYVGGGSPFFSNTWQLVTYSIVATQAWDHITFGNFDNDATTQPLSQVFSQSSSPGAYYFLDEVSVVPVTTQVSVDLGPDTTLCTGSQLILDATTPNCTYLWQDNSTQPTYTVNSAGTYWVQVTNGSGATASDTIVVSYIAPPTVNLGPDVSGCAPISVPLNATYPGATYLWQNGATTPTFTANATGSYSVDVTNQCGTVSDAMNVTVLPTVSPIDLGPDMALCAGQSLVLDGTSSNATDYLWQDGSTASSFNVSVAGTYWVEASNQCGTETDTIVVSFVTPPTVNLGADVSGCAPLSVPLDATFPGATYLWQDGATTPTYTANATGLYWVDVTNQCGTATDSINISIFPTIPPIDLGPDLSICAGQSVVLDGSSTNATAYLWQDGSTTSSINVSTAGTYWVEASNQCGTVSDTVVISIIDLVTPFDLGNDTVVCQGEIVVLDATTPFATSYLWQDGSTNPVLTVSQTGTYTVQASNQCGTETSSIYIEVIPLNVNIGNDTIICASAELILDAGAFGTTYTWNDGSSNQQFTAITSGTYWVTVQTGACSDSDTINIVLQDLFPSFSAPIRVGCEPHQSISFVDESTISSGAILDWSWTFGNQETSSIQNPTTDYYTAGSYDVSLTITSNLGCVATITELGYITINPQAIADFGFGSGSEIAFEQVDFINQSQYSTSWHWDFGDGHSSTDQNPTHNYLETGDYTIRLIAFNDYGCPDTIIHHINVTTDPILYVPNTFTPDGDEYNQLWLPIISEIDIYDYSVIIFDRWGEIIWESHDPAQGWDGTYQGKMAQDGTYTWKIEAAHSDNDERFTYVGHLNLLR